MCCVQQLHWLYSDKTYLISRQAVASKSASQTDLAGILHTSQFQCELLASDKGVHAAALTALSRAYTYMYTCIHWQQEASIQEKVGSCEACTPALHHLA